MSTDVPPVVWLEADAVDFTAVLAPISAAMPTTRRCSVPVKGSLAFAFVDVVLGRASS